MSRSARKTAFDRICSECAHCEMKGAHYRCTVGKDIVTGRGYATDCRTARADNGHCGPDGLRYVAAEIVADIRNPRKVA